MRSARLAAGLIALTLLVFPAQAQAATFTVGAANDGSGCASPPSGTNCTLRQLVNNVPAGSTIVVPATLSPYMLTTGELSIARNMTIAGEGARTTEIEQQTITPVSRVFDIQPGVTAAIAGLTIVFGKADSTSTFGPVGGDVLNRGTLTLSEDQISNGTTTGGSGAGVSNQGSGATLTVTHSLIDNNLSSASSGGGLGGGIENATTRFTAAHLSIDNSTIVNNTAAAGGGGVLSDCAGPCTSTTTITNSTIASNDGGTVASGPNGGGLLATSQGTISLLNTIVASNTVASRATPSNCGGGALITSLGHNLDSGGDCGFTATGDLQNTDPLFVSGGVSDTGGNTDTLALAANSPAVDAVPSNASGCSGTDQRDVARPQGPACDIGAYEQFEPVEGHQFSEVVAAVSGTSISINWGDGTSSSPVSVDQTTGQVTGAHTYASAGIYQGAVHYINSDHVPVQTRFDIKVSDAALTATPTSIAAVAGASFTGQVATFADGNPLASLADFTATIDWGDGTSPSSGTVTASGGGFVVSGTHTYANTGTYPMTISIADAGGSSATTHEAATAGQVPTPVLTSKPPSIGGTTAAFTGSVNPDGLPTTAYFQFGLDAKYIGAGPLAFTQSTPPQPVGSDFASHTISASAVGLVPNALYHVRLVATNAAGTTLGPDVTFTTLKTAPPGSPAVGKTFNLAPVNGVVLILVNGQLVPLTELQQIPKNTLIDALHGTLSLTTALPSTGGAHDAAARGKKAKTQSGTFGGAIFKISQARNGLATLTLVEGAIPDGPSFGTCKPHKAGDPTATAAASKTLQLLHASAKGKFSTRGRYSAATVRGTKWTIADRCDGTLTHDVTHSVAVSDFVRHKTIILHAGQSYLAKPRKRK